MKGWKSVVYLAIALGMMIYTVPQLQVGGGWSMPTAFAVVWISFGLMIVASHLHEILGVDEERQKELARIQHMKRWQLERKITGELRMVRK